MSDSTLHLHQTDDARALLELEASERTELHLPADAHVIGERELETAP